MSIYLSFKRLEGANAKHLNESENRLLKKIILALGEVLNSDNYNNLSTIIEDVAALKLVLDKGWKSWLFNSEIIAALEAVHADLNTIHDDYIEYLKTDDSSEKKLSSVFLKKHNNYLIKHFSQGKDFRGGNEKGNCYGLVYAVIQHRLDTNSYKPPANLCLTKNILYMQDKQRDKASDTEQLSSRRLNRRHYEANIYKRAERILPFLEKNKTKDLMISLSGIFHHLVYISMDELGNIHFFDPNIGFYQFTDPRKFSDFYTDWHFENASHEGGDFPFYQVSSVGLTKSMTYEGSWSGKWRSFLTGSKHVSNNVEIAGHTFSFNNEGIIPVFFAKGAIKDNHALANSQKKTREKEEGIDVSVSGTDLKNK